MLSLGLIFKVSGIYIARSEAFLDRMEAVVSAASDVEW